MGSVYFSLKSVNNFLQPRPAVEACLFFGFDLAQEFDRVRNDDGVLFAKRGDIQSHAHINVVAGAGVPGGNKRFRPEDLRIAPGEENGLAALLDGEVVILALVTVVLDFHKVGCLVVDVDKHVVAIIGNAFQNNHAFLRADGGNAGEAETADIIAIIVHNFDGFTRLDREADLGTVFDANGAEFV